MGWTHDIRYGARLLLRHPVSTAVVVATLTIAIGVSTAMFSVVHRVLIEPLPYAESDRLVLVRHALGRTGFSGAPLPAGDVADLRELDVFEAVASTNRTFPMNLTGGGPPEAIRVAGVSANFFDVLGVEPLLGRTFLPSDSRSPEPNGGGLAGPTALLIGHGLWQRQFGGSADVLGAEVTLNGEAFRIEGVLPGDFRLLMPADAGMSTDIDAWSPAPAEDRSMPRGSTYANRRVIARLAPGVTTAGARRALDALAASQRATHDYHRLSDIRIEVSPMRPAIVGHVRPILLGLFVAVGIVLLIACANVAGLLLVQGVSREREIAIRAAIGGGRARLIRQLMTESLLLSLVGGVAGLFVARWGVDLLLAFRPANLPRLEEVPIDGTALLFTAGVTLLAAVLAGTVPALHASRPDLHASLNDRGLHTPDRRRHRLRTMLVVGEMALATTLLVAAGMMVRGLQGIERIDLGFEPDSAVAFRVTLPPARYPEPDDRLAFHERLSAVARDLPGVAALGATSVLPLSGEFWTTPYRTAPDAGSAEANLQMVTAGAFAALGLRLAEGRPFTRVEERAGRRVVVVDRLLADRSWAGASAVGRRISIAGFDGMPRWYEIVGVVERVHVQAPGAPERGTVFAPYGTEGAYPMMTVVARTTGGPPETLAPALGDLVGSVDPAVPPGTVRELGGFVRDATAHVRFATLLAGLLALVALGLAAVGVYGIVSSAVRQRTRELGLRLALGAPRGRIIRSVLGRGLRLGLLGTGIGLAGSLLLASPTAALVTGVRVRDPAAYLVAGALLLGVTVLASLGPARRAVRVNPMDALRYE